MRNRVKTKSLLIICKLRFFSRSDDSTKPTNKNPIPDQGTGLTHRGTTLIGCCAQPTYPNGPKWTIGSPDNAGKAAQTTYPGGRSPGRLRSELRLVFTGRALQSVRPLPWRFPPAYFSPSSPLMRLLCRKRVKSQGMRRLTPAHEYQTVLPEATPYPLPRPPAEKSDRRAASHRRALPRARRPAG